MRRKEVASRRAGCARLLRAAQSKLADAATEAWLGGGLAWAADIADISNQIEDLAYMLEASR